MKNFWLIGQRGFDPISAKCWPTLCEPGQTLAQDRVDVSFLLGSICLQKAITQCFVVNRLHGNEAEWMARCLSDSPGGVVQAQLVRPPGEHDGVVYNTNQ